jgi:hypothetical protein
MRRRTWSDIEMEVDVWFSFVCWDRVLVFFVEGATALLLCRLAHCDRCWWHGTSGELRRESDVPRDRAV